MRVPALVVAVALPMAFLAGKYYHQAIDFYGRHATFHDIAVNRPADYIQLVDPDHPAVASLAAEFTSLAEAYYFVRDAIGFNPALPAEHPSSVLSRSNASCIGKCLLLVSIYRAMGHPADKVRIIVGELLLPGGTVEHAWVDMEHGDTCLQQDPTPLLGRFTHDQFREGDFSDSFARREHFLFNDEGFALVSQLNRFRDGSRHPGAGPSQPR